MLKNLQSKTEKFERLYRKNNSLKNGWGLSLRYYTTYKLTGDPSFIQKAYHIASTLYAINFHFIEAYFLCVLLDIEQNNLSKAQSMLDRLKSFKNAFKSIPLYHSVYTGLFCFLETKKNKNRAAKKRFNALETFNNNEDIPEIDVFLGGLAIELNENAAGIEYLKYAYGKDVQNCFLYIFLHEYFIKKDLFSDAALPLLKPFIIWGNGVGLDLEKFINKLIQPVLNLIENDMEFGKQIYKNLPLDWILKKLCEIQIQNRDYSNEAYKFYKEAELRQIYSKGLTEALVISAYKNMREDISRYTILRYLELHGDDVTIKPFVYHIILSNEDYNEDIYKYKKDIIQLGMYCLENNLEYKPYFCEIYKFILDELDESDPRLTKPLEQAASAVKETLFTYDVTTSDCGAKYVWVFEEEKKNSKIYEIIDNKAIVTAAGDNFTCFLFDESMKNASKSKITTKSRLRNVDEKLLLRFYEKGFRTTEMYIALSKYYMSFFSLPLKGVAVLENALEHGQISNSFRIKICASLGGFYASKGNFTSSVEYYNEADENYLDAKSIENKLTAYTNAGEYGAAATLISKKAAVISDKALFYSIKKIAETKSYDKIIAAASYDLTFKSWYDKILVSIALKYSQASQREWQEFARTLAVVNAPDENLDENILNNTIWIHRFDTGAQKVFVRLFDTSPNNPYILPFALYCAYEIIVNGQKPEYETIEVLEKMLQNKKGEREDLNFIAYALCHVYKNFNISTFYSDTVFKLAIELCEEDGFIFPLFKDLKDKSLLTPYIEKNQPFIYKGGKGKRVKLYYKVSGSKDGYMEKTMKYIRFGLYATNVPVFFGEKINYYFSEEISTGSIVTKEATLENNHIRLIENTLDLYYIINNAIIYESMFKYEAVEEIINDRLKEKPRIKGWLM